MSRKRNNIAFMIQKELLKQVMLDNRMSVERQVVIPRKLHMKDFTNYVLVGVRRAGKSFMLYQQIQANLREGISWDQMIYINFEDERLMGMQAEDLNLLLEVHGILSRYRPMLFLDEVQNIEGWEKFARRLADNKYKVYITGSNAKMLSRDVATTLGGRYIMVNVFPYDLKEYLRANNTVFASLSLSTTEGKSTVQRLFDEYMHFGGFPEGACLASKRDYLTSVYQKIFLGDIAFRHRIDNTFALRMIFRKMAESVKQPLSFTRLTNIIKTTGTKVSKNTIINYVNYAQEAFLILPVKNIADNLTEQETNSKYYFIDNGIISLLALDIETSLLENMVAVELMRRYGTDEQVFFYKKTVEVDFYIPDQALAIQVSYHPYATPDTWKRETDALCKLASRLDCRRLLILTFEEENTVEVNGRQIEVIPVWKWMLEEE